MSDSYTTEPHLTAPNGENADCGVAAVDRTGRGPLSPDNLRAGWGFAYGTCLAVG
jgi:hypothetical protein